MVMPALYRVHLTLKISLQNTQQAVEMVSYVGTIQPLFMFDQAQHNSGTI
jgi:hypothetical protein